MALYTPPSLPHSPSYRTMNTTLPPLPIELVHTWSAWRPPKMDLPLTPPLSAVPPRRVAEQHHHRPQTSLPPIAHLDTRMSRLSPITPPQTDDPSHWHLRGPAELKLPPVQSVAQPESPMDADEYEQPQAQVLSPPPEPVDWLTRSTHRSSQFLAEKTCEMICYLWFSGLSRDASPSIRARPSTIPKPSSATASFQLFVSHEFVRFMQKVLETTQVSQSVIVLALHYIYRLKIRNRFTNAQPGSEYRVAIAAMMMANKFLDDNTYTNKTWSEVSGIDLEEINRMEREFLLGIDFGLYVDKKTYVNWLNLLSGLVMAKERDSRNWRRTPRARIHHQSRPHRSAHPSHAVRPQRARSSSPNRSAVYPLSAPQIHYAPSAYPAHHTPPRSGAKRSATDAFSPAQESFVPLKAPRRPTGLSLDIPSQSQGPPSAHSISPSEPLQSFSKLSLGASPAGVRPVGVDNSSPAWPSTVKHNGPPQTLASAYRLEHPRPQAAPQNLYFYSLACSPTEEENRSRKARLRYHQPPATSADYGYSVQPSVPMVVQSACASPHEAYGPLSERSHQLPHFSELAWNRPRAPAPQPLPVHHHHASTAYPSPYHQTHMQPHAVHSGIQSAPFANAGPPGVHFYVHDTTTQRNSPMYNRALQRHL